MTILVLAPHTDDDAFGMGATIAKLIEQGHTVHIAAFSVCMQSVLKHLPPDTLITEFHAACDVLGVPRERRHIRDFRVRTFDRHRQEILDWMIELREDLRPTRVYMPSLRDTHQDHEVVAKEALRAFKQCTLLSYELPWNCPHFHAQYFEVLSDRHAARKVAAIGEYASQAHRRYAHRDYLYGHLALRGVQCGQVYAEAFEVVRMVESITPARHREEAPRRSDLSSSPDTAHEPARELQTATAQSGLAVTANNTNDTPGTYTPLPTNIER